MDTKTTFGIYLAWDYDREEVKINSMAKKGWQLVNSIFNGWHYFRKPYAEGMDEEEYELYTDNASLMEMLNRWIMIARVFQIILMVYFVLNFVHFILSKNIHNGLDSLFTILTAALFQASISAMKQKRVQKNYMPYKGINISYLLISAMLITFILMLI